MVASFSRLDTQFQAGDLLRLYMWPLTSWDLKVCEAQCVLSLERMRIDLDIVLIKCEEEERGQGRSLPRCETHLARAGRAELSI